MYFIISQMVKEQSPHRFIGIGKAIGKYRHYFDNGEFFDSTEEFNQTFPLEKFQNEIILVKGARVFHFENIIRQLLNKVHGTVLQINLDALSNNLNFYRSQLKASTKIMVMVKAFAYGSGSFEVANLLQFHRVDYLGVAYADEGVSLRENGITLPIMVMNPSRESFEKLIRHNLEPEIYSFNLLKSFLAYLQDTSLQWKCHIKIDTGMKRLGFEYNDLQPLITCLKNYPKLQVASIFTHLAGADDGQHNQFSQSQLNNFNIASSAIEKTLGYPVLKHGLNSAGIIRFPDWQMDMVRLGIGLYGVETNGLKQHKLQEVGTLKTVISQIKKVSHGETVGYSRKGVLEQDAEIATIAIGYADGYSRKLGYGVGKILVNGMLCPTVGSVCMDMTMVNVSGTSSKEGDEVILFGSGLPVSDLASSIGTIPYEILTGINERVRRVFYAE